MKSHRGFQAPAGAGASGASMNQTQSVCKREGSGVGILCDSEARCFRRRRRPAPKGGPGSRDRPISRRPTSFV